MRQESSATAKNEVPAWLDWPCQDQPPDAICAVGESDFAAVDIEAAKTDAEVAAKNRIADQLNAKIARLVTRVRVVLKDFNTGKAIGQSGISDANQTFTEQTLKGLRYTEYFYHPSRFNAQKVFVRAILAPNHAELSQNVIDAMLGLSQGEKLQANHQKALERLEHVRQQYLQEVTQPTRDDSASTQ